MNISCYSEMMEKMKGRRRLERTVATVIAKAAFAETGPKSSSTCSIFFTRATESGSAEGFFETLPMDIYMAMMQSL